MPRLTVILPAKDTARYLPTTLATLQTQFDDPRDLQVVMIDDGSRDATGALMREFAERWPLAEVITNAAPVGLASARNQGLERVEADAFAFLDGDDWLQPQRFAVLTDALDDLGVDYVRTDHVTSTEGVRRLVSAPFPWRNRSVSPRDAILPAYAPTMVDYPYAWAGIFRSSLIDQGLAGFRHGLFTAEDRPWIWRLHLGAERFAVVDAPSIIYRRGVATSLTQTQDRRQLDVIPALAEAIDIVQHDRDRERFLPKITNTTFVLGSHHLRRAGRVGTSLRREFREGLQSLLERLPPDLVRREFTLLSERRRRLMAPIVREAVDA